MLYSYTSKCIAWPGVPVFHKNIAKRSQWTAVRAALDRTDLHFPTLDFTGMGLSTSLDPSLPLHIPSSTYFQRHTKIPSFTASKCYKWVWTSQAAARKLQFTNEGHRRTPGDNGVPFERDRKFRASTWTTACHLQCRERQDSSSYIRKSRCVARHLWQLLEEM